MENQIKKKNSDTEGVVRISEATVLFFLAKGLVGAVIILEVPWLYYRFSGPHPAPQLPLFCHDDTAHAKNSLSRPIQKFTMLQGQKYLSKMCLLEKHNRVKMCSINTLKLFISLGDCMGRLYPFKNSQFKSHTLIYFSLKLGVASSLNFFFFEYHELHLLQIFSTLSSLETKILFYSP